MSKKETLAPSAPSAVAPKDQVVAAKEPQAPVPSKPEIQEPAQAQAPAPRTVQAPVVSRTTEQQFDDWHAESDVRDGHMAPDQDRAAAIDIERKRGREAAAVRDFLGLGPIQADAPSAVPNEEQSDNELVPWLYFKMRPYAPHRGWTLKRFAHTTMNLIFDSGVWYKWPNNERRREMLRELTQYQQNGDSAGRNMQTGNEYPSIFDVALTAEERERVNAFHLAQVAGRRRAVGSADSPRTPGTVRPVTLTSEQMRSRRLGRENDEAWSESAEQQRRIEQRRGPRAPRSAQT